MWWFLRNFAKVVDEMLRLNILIQLIYKAVTKMASPTHLPYPIKSAVLRWRQVFRDSTCAFNEIHARDNLSSHFCQWSTTKKLFTVMGRWRLDIKTDQSDFYFLFLFSGLAKMNDFKFRYFELHFFALHC